MVSLVSARSQVPYNGLAFIVDHELPALIVLVDRTLTSIREFAGADDSILMWRSQLCGAQLSAPAFVQGRFFRSLFGRHITVDIVQPLAFTPIHGDALCDSQRKCVGVSDEWH
jgi:hypothetical protein